MAALLNVAECAGLLRVTSETVRRLAHDGAIPAVRVGKQLRFDGAAVLESLHKRGLSPSPAEARE